MLVLNYSHALTPEQRSQIAKLISVDPADIEEQRIPVQYDYSQPLLDYARSLVGDEPALATPYDYIINLPGFAPLAALVAHLHNRQVGHPRYVLTRMRPGTTPTVFDVVALVDPAAL